MRKTVVGFFFYAPLLGLCLVQSAVAQQLRFGKSLGVKGEILGAGVEFAYSPPKKLTIAAKFVGRAPLPIDTLFVIVKDLNGIAGRYLMLRSKQNKVEANSLIRFKDDGIYRVYVYNPHSRIKPIAHATVYITSSSMPDRAVLLERQRQILVDRGVIKDIKAPKLAVEPAIAEAKNTATSSSLKASPVKNTTTLPVKRVVPAANTPKTATGAAEPSDDADALTLDVDEEDDTSTEMDATLSASADATLSAADVAPVTGGKSPPASQAVEPDDDPAADLEEDATPADLNGTYTAPEELQDDLDIDIDSL